MKQISFSQHKDHKSAMKGFTARSAHGGSLNKGKRKTHRPFDSRRPMHLTMRAPQARGKWSFLETKNQRFISRTLYSLSNRFGLKIYRYSNAGNHLHILLKASKKEDFQNFLRTFAALIARFITKACKGKPLQKRFWEYLAHTRLVSWGREFKMVRNYVILNTLEAFGIVPQRAPGQRAPRAFMAGDLRGQLEDG